MIIGFLLPPNSIVDNETNSTSLAPNTEILGPILLVDGV